MDRLKAVFVIVLLLGILLPSASPVVVVSEPMPPIIIVGNVPRGFVVAPYEMFKVYFYIADDFGGVTTGKGRIEAYYRVNGGDWKQAYVTKAAAGGENWSIYQSIIHRFYGESQDFYVFYREATLPGAPPGSRVEFKIAVTDAEGHVSYSPVYSYYVANPDGPRILIVDPPSVEAMAFEKSLESLMAQFNASRSFYHYNLSDFEAVAEPLRALKPWMLSDHHWEELAKYYNIRIVSPDELVNALQSFQPDAVILSNLWLPPDWGGLSGEEISALEDYLKGTHAGLIVTAGTLFDATNSGHLGGINGSAGLTGLLGLDSLTIANSLKGSFNLSNASVMLPFVNTGYSLVLSKEGPFSGGTIDVTAYSTVGWQCVLSPVQFGIARRSVSRSIAENSRMLELVESIKNLTGVQFNFSLSASMELPNLVASMEVTDDGVAVNHDGEDVELSVKRGLLERIRLLQALRGRVPILLAHTEDYSGGILATEGDYRAVYSSLELEAGGSDELSVLKELVDWVVNYKPVEMPEVIVLANDIDWGGIRGESLASQLEALGLPVKRVTAGDFKAYEDSKVVIILGGPDAYDGVGGYVREVLTTEEQDAVRKGERGTFVKTDVWANGQVVIVLAGRDRWGTSGKIKAYMNGVDDSYLRILATFSASVS